MSDRVSPPRFDSVVLVRDQIVEYIRERADEGDLDSAARAVILDLAQHIMDGRPWRSLVGRVDAAK